MPHDDHQLALLELRVAEYTVALSAHVLTESLADGTMAYRLLRKIRPNVDKVLTEIQKHVISLSLSDTGDGSAGFSYVGSSSISNSVLSRGSTLSTRPSVEGRFSTAVGVSQDVVHRVVLFVVLSEALGGPSAHHLDGASGSLTHSGGVWC